MGFYSLPLEKKNVKIPEEYCYLILFKYPENHFKPKGKKFTAEELKEKKDYIQKQQETIKQLDTGYCNLHNHKIELDCIFDHSFMSYFRDYNDNTLIYKILPLASNEVSRNYSYSNKKFEVSEFNIIKKFNDKNEVIAQIYKDKLLPEFSAVMFDGLSYGNEGYNLKLFDYFQYINNVFSGLEISLSDIVLDLENYKHEMRSKFNKNDTGKVTKDNIRYLLDNKLIKYFKEGDYYQVRLVVGLVDCGLFDVALDCIKLLEDYYIQQLLKEKDFDIALRKWSTDKTVKEIINTLGIKLSGLTLTVKEYMEYGEDRIVEVKNFDNIGNVKTHLIKEYDIPFDKVMGEDIDGLQTENYEFSVS